MNNSDNNNTHAHTLTKKELTRAGKLGEPLSMPTQTPPTKHSVDEENDEQQRANVPQGGKRQR